MNLIEIKKTHIPKKRRKRIGRGSGTGQGCTAGKGQKGQNSRQGVGRPSVFEGGTMPLYRRLPKRGFNNKRFQKNWISINVDELDNFKEGEIVTLESLAKAFIIDVPKSKKTYLKLLGRGELKVKNLRVRAHKVSKSAREQLEKTNGKVEIIAIKKFKRLRNKKKIAKKLDQ